MIGQTNSQVFQNETGGGDTIYLTNDTGSSLSDGDKVLCNFSVAKTYTPQTFSLTGSFTSYYNPICGFDNDKFIAPVWNNGSELFSSSCQTFSHASSSLSSSVLSNKIFVYHEDGVISTYTPGYSNYTDQYIIKDADTSALITGNTHEVYIGSGVGGQYCCSLYAGGDSLNVYQYDVATNTLGSSVLSISSDILHSLNFGKVVNNLCVLIGTNLNNDKVALVYSITENQNDEITFTLLKSSTIDDCPLYLTGCGVGHYLLATDNVAGAYTSTSSVQPSYLICYQIQSDYSFLKVDVPELSMFKAVACLISYDNRNKVLSIGTHNGAYFYKFERTHQLGNINGWFYRINVKFDTLPAVATNWAYRAVMSVNMDKVIVCNASHQYYAYILKNPEHLAQVNADLCYDAHVSFSGFATGNTNQAGKYEIKTVLPDTVNFSIGVISPAGEPDQVLIYGGAE